MKDFAYSISIGRKNQISLKTGLFVTIKLHYFTD